MLQPGIAIWRRKKNFFSKRREYTRLFSEHKEYLNLYEIIFVRRVYIYLCLALDLHLNRSKKSAKIQLKKSAKQI